jgi:hypothetical protein
VVLRLVGLIFLVGVYPLMMFLWPSGWRRQPHQPEYERILRIASWVRVSEAGRNAGTTEGQVVE